MERDGWGGTLSCGTKDSKREAETPRHRDKGGRQGHPGMEKQGDGDPDTERDQGEASVTQRQARIHRSPGKKRLWGRGLRTLRPCRHPRCSFLHKHPLG